MPDYTLEYIRRYYKVPAEKGARVRFEGKAGTILSGASGPYLRVRLDGEKWARTYHPTWHLEYDADPDAGKALEGAGE